MFHDIITQLDNLIGALQTQLFIGVIEPLFFRFGLMGYADDLYDSLYWVIIGVLEIAATYALLRPLEALRPLEVWRDRKALRTDVLYTWIAKLGLINLAVFLVLQPLFSHWQSLMVIYHVPNVDLSNRLGVTDKPLLSFAVYLVVLDFAGYWYHRWQHRFGVWWELHAVHHSQQQVSMWADDRNHFFDSVLLAAYFAVISLFIGVEPNQYVVLIAVGNLLQSIQHVNARLPYHWLLERIIVSPAFHRRHHAIGYGHEGTRYGCNFGVLFPWWDMLLGTASWDKTVEATGIRDQLPVPQGTAREYGRGLLAQQWYAFARIGERLAGRRRYTSDVSS